MAVNTWSDRGCGTNRQKKLQQRDMVMNANFKQHSIASAPDASKMALQQIEKRLGFLPNLFATLAESPVTLEGYLGLDGVLAKGTFSAAERQILEIAVSTANGCDYCTAAHSTFARSLRAPEDAIIAARGEGVTTDLRLQALVHFTHAVVRERGHIGREELETFLDVGFTPPQALEIVAHVGLKTISNYIDGLAHVPLDAQFREHARQPAPVAS
jgi:uncharacterized peroxidase-related enzyme